MVRFIVDSTLGVTEQYAEENQVQVVNLKLILDGVTTEEGYEKDWGEFYTRFKTSSNFPTTSQPNPEDFENAIRAIYEKEADADIVIITIASNLSGTVNSARLAAKSFPGKNIAVIDSENASASSFLLLDELVSAAKDGSSFEDVVSLARVTIPKLSIQFIPASMEYLKRGGRVGTLSAIIASLISIKPIFDFRNNLITVPKKLIGMSKAITEVIMRLPKKIKKMYVVYIHDNTHVNAVVEKIKALLGKEKVDVLPVSPVFGVHVGIGAFGISCLEG